MKKISILLMFFLVFCFLFTGCPSPLTVDPETTPDETPDNTPEEASVITSSAKNISLTAQDDGILITLTKEDDFPYTYVSIRDVEKGIGVNVVNEKWVNNKAEILYPFSESGKVSRFNLVLSNNVRSDSQTVEITATGGIGSPITSLFEEIKLTPSYNSTDDSFGVTVNTTAETISDFFSNSVNSDNRFTSKRIYVQFYLGSPGRTFGYSSRSIGTNNGISGFYKHNFNGTHPDYSEYDNKFFALAWLSFSFNGFSFWYYAKSTSEICAITNAPKIYFFVVPQNDGILLSFKKEESCSISDIIVKGFITDSQAANRIGNFIIRGDKLNWTNNKAEILFPYAEKNNFVQFTCYGPDDFSKTVVTSSKGGSKNFPSIKDSISKTLLKPSFDDNTKQFSIDVDTNGLTVSDIIKDNACYQNLSVKCVKLNLCAGYRNNNNNKFIGSVDLNSCDLSIACGSYVIPITGNVDISSYIRMFFSNFFAEIVFGVDLDELYFEVPSRSESYIIPLPEAEYISLEAVNDGILITVTNREDWRTFVELWVIEMDGDSINVDDLMSDIRTIIDCELNNWENNTAEILYPFTVSGKKYCVLSKYDSLDNTGNVSEIVGITATGGYGENPKRTLLKQIDFEPSYDASTDTFYVNVDATEETLSELVKSYQINNNWSFGSGRLEVMNLLGNPKHGTGLGIVTISPNNNTLVPGWNEIKKSNNAQSYNYSDYNNEGYLEIRYWTKLSSNGYGKSCNFWINKITDVYSIE